VASSVQIALVDTPDRARRSGEALAGARGVSLAVEAHHGAPFAPKALLAVDVVVVGLFDPSAAFDRCPGVELVDRLADMRPGAQPALVAVADGRVSDLVRLRLVEAGADHLVATDTLAQLGALADLAGSASTTWRPIKSSMELAHHGLGLTSRLNAGLAHIVSNGLEAAFRPGSGAGGGLSRRRAITVRTALAEIVGIQAVGEGSGAVLARSLPSWRQLAELVWVARGADSAGA